MSMKEPRKKQRYKILDAWQTPKKREVLNLKFYRICYFHSTIKLKLFK